MFGLEAQYDWADLNRAYYGPVGTWSVGTKVDAIGLFTGRIGYAVNNALFYVKGGAAVANNDRLGGMERCEFRHGIQYALGWCRWRWLGIRL